jgi:hypothetical protein
MSEAALSNPPVRPRPLTRPHRQRFPAGNGPGALPGFRHVGHAGEQPAQLGGSRQLASLVEGGADRGGFCLGDDEHPRSMGTRTVTRKRRALAYRLTCAWRPPARVAAG